MADGEVKTGEGGREVPLAGAQAEHKVTAREKVLGGSEPGRVVLEAQVNQVRWKSKLSPYMKDNQYIKTGVMSTPLEHSSGLFDRSIPLKEDTGVDIRRTMPSSVLLSNFDGTSPTGREAYKAVYDGKGKVTGFIAVEVSTGPDEFDAALASEPQIVRDPDHPNKWTSRLGDSLVAEGRGAWSKRFDDIAADSEARYERFTIESADEHGPSEFDTWKGENHILDYATDGKLHTGNVYEAVNVAWWAIHGSESSEDIDGYEPRIGDGIE